MTFIATCPFCKHPVTVWDNTVRCEGCKAQFSDTMVATSRKERAGPMTIITRTPLK